MSIQQPSCFFNPVAQTSADGTACSLLPWLAVLTPGHPSNHPHILLFYGDISLTPQPTSQRSFSPQRGHPLRWLRRLRVVLFLGLALVHRICVLGAARSTWSTNNSHRKRLSVGAHTWKCLLITRKIMIPPPDSWDPPEGSLYFAKKCSPRCQLEPTSYIFARKEVPHYYAQKMNTPPTKLTGTEGFVNLVNTEQ